MNNRLSSPWLKAKRIIGWSLFVLIIVTQWEVSPWLFFSATFAVLASTWQILDIYNQPRLFKIIILTGGLFNFLALIVNGGRMPVLGRTEVSRWWEPLTDSSYLVPLCDIYFKCSIGDMVITVGMLTAIVSWLVRRKTTTVMTRTVET